MNERFKKEIKSYILKNKDISVLRFDYEKILDITSIGEYPNYKFKHINILREDLLPKSLENNVNSNILKAWIDLRKVPKNRKNVNSILNYRFKDEITDPNNYMNYIDLSYGLSFNDSYWIIPDDGIEYKWEDYNLYKNKFSETLSLIAFGEKTLNSIDDVRTSPEYTTDGMLAKCWTVINDEIYLLKKSSENHKVEAYAEFYMAQIAEVMKFEHVSYDLIKFHNYIVSACPIFTNENEGYIPIHSCLSKTDKWKKTGRLLEAIAEIIGKEKLGDIMVFDSIIYNTDRHLGNFGMIIDNNNGSLLRAAPIFDNGTSILNLISKEKLEDIYKNYSSKLEIDFDILSKNFVREEHRDGLEKLKKFKFKRHEKYNISDEILEKAENFIQSRSRLILNQLNLIKENTKISKIKKSKDRSFER